MSTWRFVVSAACVALVPAPAGAQVSSSQAPTTSAGTAATAPVPAESAQPPKGAATTAQPQPHVPAGASASSQTAAPKPDAKAQAAKAKQELAQREDVIAARWHQRAASEGWTAHPPAESTNAAASNGQPSIKSEKAGTAPSSPDAKQPRPPAQNVH